MADHEGSEPRNRQALSELFRSTTGGPASDLAEALDGLDRATRNFARRLGEDHEPAPEATDVDLPSLSAREIYDARMLAAEREALEYLDHAKRRADSLVISIVGAVEREADEIRRDAEAGIRQRWRAVEVDAQRHAAEARQIAESMVAERQRRIAALSDEITGRAQALTAGMDDADRVRAQFDSFVRSLSATAAQIAGGTDLRTRRRAAGTRDDQDRPRAIAA